MLLARRASSSERRRTNGAGGGSDESTARRDRRRDACPQKLDRNRVRKTHVRCPFATIDVSKDGKFVFSGKVVGSGGIAFCGQSITVSEKPAWAFENPMSKEKAAFLPDEALLVVHPGEQRYFMRYKAGTPPTGPMQVLLDVTASDLRDRLILQDGMEFIFTDGKNEKTVRVELSPSTRADPGAAWHRRLEDDEFWVLKSRLDEGSSFADDPSLVTQKGLSENSDADDAPTKEYSTLLTQGSSAAVMSEVEHVKPVIPRPMVDRTSSRRVTWGLSKVVTINAEGDAEMVQEHDLGDVEMSADDAKEGSDSVQASNDGMISVTVDGAPFLSISGDDFSAHSKSVIVQGGTNQSDPSSFISLPFAMQGEAIAAFSFGMTFSQLITPRIVKPKSKVRILLVIPTSVMFPLVAGDVIAIRSKAHGEATLKFSIPKLSRAPPSARSPASERPTTAPSVRGNPTMLGTVDDSGNLGGVLNPEHFMVGIAVEGTYQVRKSRWNGSVETKTNSDAVVYTFPGEFFSPPDPPPEQLVDPTTYMVRIGRSEDKCNVAIPDPHLSRLHALISRHSKDHFLLSPADNKDGKKAVFLLCGKTDSHNRPPVALRTGDTIYIGRSEFKVVFQQRGDRKVPPPGKTSQDELEARLNTLHRRLKLAVKGESNSTLEDRPVSPGDDVDEDLVSHFKTLNPSASEKSSTSNPRLSKASQVTEVPTFKDLNALVEHFDLSSAVSGPMMILMSVRGPKARQFFVCNPLETTIGSSLDADICISNDRRMSPLHCRIYFDSDMERWLLDDLQSKHGTFLKVDEPILLCSGDVFIMGLSLFRIFGNALASTSGTGKTKCNQQ